MASPEAAARTLPEVARLGEEYGSRLDGAYRLLDGGALVGPAAYALFTGMSAHHRVVRNAFLDAFDQVHRLARHAQPPASVTLPSLRHPPLGLVPAPRGVLSGSPEQLNLLAGELARTGRGWEDAGKILGGILGGLGLSRGPGVVIGRAGAWAVSERRDLERRRNELLKLDESGAFIGVLQAQLDAVMVSTLAARDPALAARLDGAGVNLSQIPTGRATDVNAWWKTLTAEQRALYVKAFPSRIGWTNGVPSADRDKANRLTLTTRLAELQGKPAGRLTPFERRDLERLKKLDEKLRTIAARGRSVYLLGLDSTTAGPWDGYGEQGVPLGGKLPKVLADATPGPDGRVIVAIGNPDTAAHTGVYVPGTTAELDTIDGDIERAENPSTYGRRRPREIRSRISAAGATEDRTEQLIRSIRWCPRTRSSAAIT